MTMDVGATLAAGPTAAMQKDERTLIETGMVSLANRYPDRFVSGGDALGPGMLAVGCLLWIRRIIKDRRNVAETSASLPPNPLAENWQPQQQSEQPEWVPADIPAIFTEQPQPNGALYEGAGDYDWVRQYTTIT